MDEEKRENTDESQIEAHLTPVEHVSYLDPHKQERPKVEIKEKHAHIAVLVVAFVILVGLSIYFTLKIYNITI